MFLNRSRRRQIRTVRTRFHYWGAGFLVPVLWFSPVMAAAPRVGVVESPTAAAWIRSAGLECVEVTGEQLAESAPEVPLLVVPLARVRSEGALRAITAFMARGGKVIAVYWGTIARPEQQSTYPVYGAAPLLGVRIVGWTLIGPAVVRPEMPALGGGLGARDPRGFSSASPAGRGSAVRNEDRLSRVMMVRIDPAPSAQVLARLVPESGGPPLALAVRNGNLFYAAANLFQPEADASEMRHLFFWMVDQAAPGLVYAGVRERAGAAAAAVIRARERLTGQPAPNAEAVRKLLDEADTAASRAKTLAAGNDFAGSIAASDQARELADRALGLLEGH